MKYFAAESEAVLAELDVDLEQGLSDQSVSTRLEEYGTNELQHARRRGAWPILLQQFKSVVIIILAIAGVAALATAQWVEAIAIAAVVVINTLIGFITEYKAIRSMEALREMGGHQATVRRGGQQQQVDVRDLVPGDIALIEKGNLVPADLRLIEANKLRVDEAALTGESVPADKTSDPVDEDAPLAERRCMLFKGTSVADGNAIAVVVATGTDTELGRVSHCWNNRPSSASSTSIPTP